MNPKAWVEGVFELIWRILIRVILWSALGYLLYRVRSIFVTIILAAVLTYMVLPIIDFLCSYKISGISKKFQRLIATTIVFAALITVVGYSITQFITPFKNELSDISIKINSSIEYIKINVAEWQDSLPPDLQNFLLSQRFETIFDRLGNWGTTVIKSTYDFLSHLIEMILIPVLAFYFALDSKSLKREFVALVPKRRSREILAIIHEINSIMRSYIIGQIILCLIAGIFVALLLYITGMHYELLLGVFSGITRAIPVIGPIISGAIIVLMGLSKSPALGLNLLIIFSGLHFAESKFIMPKLIGDRMQLHPVLVIVVLLIGAEFFGIFGMFMAAPAAAVLRVLIRYYFIKPNQMHVWGMRNIKPTEHEANKINEEESTK